jgi:hypothetical protein
MERDRNDAEGNAAATENDEQRDFELNFKVETFKESQRPEYILHGNYRLVKHYSFAYRTHAKRRWLKQKLLDAFVKEFKAYDENYYVNY